MTEPQDEQQITPIAEGQPCVGESSVQPAALAAMVACFSLCEAIAESKLSINDLIEVCDMSIQEGHEMMQISLTMMLKAVEVSHQRQKEAD